MLVFYDHSLYLYYKSIRDFSFNIAKIQAIETFFIVLSENCLSGVREDAHIRS